MIKLNYKLEFLKIQFRFLPNVPFFTSFTIPIFAISIFMIPKNMILNSDYSLGT